VVVLIGELLTLIKTDWCNIKIIVGYRVYFCPLIPDLKQGKAIFLNSVGKHFLDPFVSYFLFADFKCQILGEYT
jgi:hypothetical protein